MLDPQFNGWRIFEAYTHELMANGASAPYECQACVGSNSKEYKKKRTVTLGGCSAVRLVLDIVQAAMETPDVLFHSVDSNNPLIDFLYRDEKGAFHAFQATIGSKHSANPTKIKELEEQVGGGGKLSLYYLVPDNQFKRFVTNPADPRKEGASCDIWKVLIPDPNRSGSRKKIK